MRLSHTLRKKRNTSGRSPQCSVGSHNRNIYSPFWAWIHAFIHTQACFLPLDQDQRQVWRHSQGILGEKNWISILVRVWIQPVCRVYSPAKPQCIPSVLVQMSGEDTWCSKDWQMEDVGSLKCAHVLVYSMWNGNGNTLQAVMWIHSERSGSPVVCCLAKAAKHNAHSMQLFKNEVRISFVHQTAVYKSLV